MTNKHKIEKLFDFMEISHQLKKTLRYKNVKEMPWKESTAGHSWNVALLTFIIADEIDIKLDVLKALKIALVHDLVEAIADDVDHSLIAWGIVSKEEKNKNEIAAMEQIRKSLPERSGQEIYDLWYEYEEAKTPEAKYVKALDKIEGIDHMHCIGTECFDHPELIAPYPMKAVANFPELIPVLDELNKRLKPQFQEKGWEWKKEYEIESRIKNQELRK